MEVHHHAHTARKKWTPYIRVFINRTDELHTKDQ